MLLTKLKRFWLIWRAKQKNNLLIRCWKQDQIRKNQTWKETEFLVLDTETSSLSAKTGEILSIGWVLIKNGSVILNSAEYYLLQPKNSVGESATIHQLRDCEFVEGISNQEMLTHFLKVATGKVIVCHHALLDIGFLNNLTQECYGLPLLWSVVDTLQIEKRLLEKKEMPLGQSVLRLASCRARYNLPPYPAHNALADALATAELLLAQIAYKGDNTLLQDLI